MESSDEAEEKEAGMYLSVVMRKSIMRCVVTSLGSSRRSRCCFGSSDEKMSLTSWSSSRGDRREKETRLSLREKGGCFK